MKKYISFFRIRFYYNLQYRVAALAGLMTQFAWGFLTILMHRAFYRSNPAAYPMEFSALTAYIWLQQAFLTLYAVDMWDQDLFDSITNGNIAYDLCRPVDLYSMWFSRFAATRVARAMVRCFPVLIVALILPPEYRLYFNQSLPTYFYFALTMVLAFMVAISFSILIYISTFYTLSSMGIRVIVGSLGYLLVGGIVPLPFFPDSMQKFLSLLPFASMQNVPFRVFSGDIAGAAMYEAILLQCFWILLMTFLGKLWMQQAVKKIVVQGG